MSQYFYKILDEAPPKPLPQRLPSTDLDNDDKFIHLSTAKQVPITADLFYSTIATIYLLKVRVRDLDGEIRYDEQAGPDCPHLHDSEEGLGKNNVADVVTIEKGQHSTWTTVEALRELED